MQLGYEMTNDEFKQLLKKAGLNKKEFANVAHINYNTIRNWQKIPAWVKPFLENYIKAKTLDSVKDVICDESSSPIGDKSDG